MFSSNFIVFNIYFSIAICIMNTKHVEVSFSKHVYYCVIFASLQKIFIYSTAGKKKITTKWIFYIISKARHTMETNHIPTHLHLFRDMKMSTKKIPLIHGAATHQTANTCNSALRWLRLHIHWTGHSYTGKTFQREATEHTHSICRKITEGQWCKKLQVNKCFCNLSRYLKEKRHEWQKRLFTKPKLRRSYKIS